MNDPVAAGAITWFEKLQLEELLTQESKHPKLFDINVQLINGYYPISFIIRGRNMQFWEVSSYDFKTLATNLVDLKWSIVKSRAKYEWAIQRSEKLNPWITPEHIVKYNEMKKYPSQDITAAVSKVCRTHLNEMWTIGGRSDRQSLIQKGDYFMVRIFIKNYTGTLETINELGEDLDFFDMFERDGIFEQHEVHGIS